MKITRTKMTPIQKLESFKARLIEYLKLKVEQHDFHGVSDAANDIREVEAKIAVLKELEATGKIQIKSPYIPADKQEDVNRISTEYAKALAEALKKDLQT